MRKHLLVVSAVLLAGAVALATDPPDRLGLSQREIIISLNGSYTELGTAQSVDGGPFSTCINTASPFDAGLGDVISWSCSDPVFAKNGDCTTVAATTSQPVAVATQVVTVLQTTEMAVAWRQQDGGSSARCSVGHMK